MFVLYDIFFFVTALIYLPYLLWKRKWHAGLWIRLGIAPLPFQAEIAQKTIWVHAVSVGEVLTIVPLAQNIRNRFPAYSIVLSTVTPTGYKLAQTELDGIVTVIYAPLDFSWVVRRYIDALQPAVYISAETEWWPNLYALLCDRHIPIVQVNGRISDGAFRGYRRVALLTRRVLRCVRVFCMQSQVDADRVTRLGAEAGRVRVVGNLKFDHFPVPTSFTKEKLALTNEDRLVIAGSTHPGEEEIVLDIYKKLHEEFPELRLVIAPRHVERSDEIAQLCRSHGFRHRKFSQLLQAQGRESGDVFVIDRIGYLRDLYGLAELVFIGKTLRGRGGQNMLEPLMYGKPTLVGPRTENFRDIVAIFLKTGALIQVKDEKDLMAHMRRLLNDPQRRIAIAAAAQEEFAKHQGATAKTMEAITEILDA